jgi:hypothetical protein
MTEISRRVSTLRHIGHRTSSAFAAGVMASNRASQA